MKIFILIILTIFSMSQIALSTLHIDGDFNGWEGETIVKLDDGTFWIQSEYYYKYCYKYNPKVELYREYGKIKMLVDGCGDKGVSVEQIEAFESEIVNDFDGFDDGNLYELRNGQIWKQIDISFGIAVRVFQKVIIYQKSGSYYIKLVDDDDSYRVELVSGNTTNNRNRINSYNNNSTFLKVQNNTDKTIFFCYSAYNGSNGWQSNGWYKAESYSSNSINIGYYTGKIYFYAEYNAGELTWFDPNSKFMFCIDKSNAFNIPNADSRDCSNSNYKRVKMSEFSITPGVFTWTLNP